MTQVFSSALLALACVVTPIGQGESSLQELRNEAEHELEVRLGLRSANTGRRARIDPGAQFYVEQEGLGAVPGSTSHNRGKMLGERMAHNAANVIEEGRLVKVPKKSGFQFPAGEPVRIAAINVDKNLERVTIRVETMNTHSFTGWNGRSLSIAVVAELEFTSLSDKLKRGDFDALLVEIKKWIGVTKPTTPPTPAAYTAASDAADAGGPPSAQNQQPLQLVEGQTPEEVEKILGKPQEREWSRSTRIARMDQTASGEDLVYTYPTVKVFFKNGKLVDVQERKK